MAGEYFTSRARARARAIVSELDAARRRTLFPGALVWTVDLAEHLKSLLALEAAPGRLIPWLPVGFGTGIVLYFAADREPALWAASGVAVVGIACAIAARRRMLSLAIALAFASIACGFAVATIKSVSIGHPILRYAATADIKGFVEIREEREKTDRIVVRVTQIGGSRLNAAPKRIRVAVRKGTAPLVGEFVAFRARLLPPLGPLRPGGYDFARDMFFQNIGASGYVFGRIKAEKPPLERDFSLRYQAFIDGIRELVDDRIRTSLSGDRGPLLRP